MKQHYNATTTKKKNETTAEKTKNSLGRDDALGGHVHQDAVLGLDVLAAHVGERRVLHGPVPDLARRHHAHVVHLGTLPDNAVRNAAGNPQELPEKGGLLARLHFFVPPPRKTKKNKKKKGPASCHVQIIVYHE